MKVFLDSDVLLDVFLKREPFYDASSKVLNLALLKRINGMTSPVVIANIYYILTRHKVSCSDDIIREMLDYITITRMDHATIAKAFSSEYKDKEDALQYFAAEKEKTKYFITRNIKHHASPKICVVTPDDFLNIKSIKNASGVG